MFPVLSRRAGSPLFRKCQAPDIWYVLLQGSARSVLTMVRCYRPQVVQTHPKGLAKAIHAALKHEMRRNIDINFEVPSRL